MCYLLFTSLVYVYTALRKEEMIIYFLFLQNCELGMLPHYEHDDNLYLNKREQMAYNVEERARVDSKYTVPDRSVMLKPERHHPTARYRSTLMHRLPWRSAEKIKSQVQLCMYHLMFSSFPITKMCEDCFF